MRISVASTDDAPRVAAMVRASFDDRLSTVAGWRYRMANTKPEDLNEYWRAEHDGELVGWAFGGRDSFAPAGTMGYAGIVVHPSFRRQGAGSALWDVLSAHLDEIGVPRIVAHSRADTDSKAFVAASGFTLEATGHHVRRRSAGARRPAGAA